MQDRSRREPVLDSWGFLEDMNDWDESVMKNLMRRDGFTVTDEAARYVIAARRIYLSEGRLPGTREFAAYLGVSRERIFRVFRYNPLYRMSKWGGLPRPTGCLFSGCV